MKEKDFQFLSVNEQKDKINDFITSWYKQDLNNRCAIVILGDRKNKQDAGKTSCCMLGPGDLITASLEAALNKNEVLQSFTFYCLMGPYGELLSMLDNSK